MQCILVLLATAHLCNHQALCGLCLDALCHIYNQDDHVNDLSASHNGADEGGVAWAVHEGELQLCLGQLGLEVLGHGQDDT